MLVRVAAVSRAVVGEYLLTREVAQLLRAPESTVRYWRHIRSGPPSIKVGRRVLYRREAVAAWLAAREQAEVAVPHVQDSAVVIAERVRRRGGPRRTSTT